MNPSWFDDLLRLLALQDANTRVVLAGTALLGLASGVVGTFAMLRKRALVGDAVSHAALPGICIAYLVIGSRNFTLFLLGALLMGLLAAAIISLIRSYTRVKEDSATAIAIGTFFGLGLVLSSYIQRSAAGNRAGLDSFLFGKAASMDRTDVFVIAIVAIGALLAITVLYKELKLLCFNSEYASGLGWPVHRLDLALMGLVCICTIAGLPAVGVVLMVALLVIPAAAARMWSDRLIVVIALSGFFGALSGILGTCLSAVLPVPANALSRGWPTGPMIVLVAATFFIVSVLFAPARGVIASALRRHRLRRSLATLRSDFA